MYENQLRELTELAEGWDMNVREAPQVILTQARMGAAGLENTGLFRPGPKSSEKKRNKAPCSGNPGVGRDQSRHPHPIFQAASIFRVRASLAWATGRSWGGDRKGKAPQVYWIWSALPCGNGHREVGPLRMEYLTGIHRF